MTRFTEMEAADTKTNHELTEDYRGLTLKYKDLQAKFRHFEIADTTKYDEVWAMHEGEVKDLVDQLLKADKIISEQHLGLVWRPPDMHALQHVLGRHGGLGLGANAAAADNEDGAGTHCSVDVYVCTYHHIHMWMLCGLQTGRAVTTWRPWSWRIWRRCW